MKTDLRQLYGACILAFASEDDEIMNSALRAFEAELRQRLKEIQEDEHWGLIWKESGARLLGQFELLKELLGEESFWVRRPTRNERYVLG